MSFRSFRSWLSFRWCRSFRGWCLSFRRYIACWLSRRSSIACWFGFRSRVTCWFGFRSRVAYWSSITCWLSLRGCINCWLGGWSTMVCCFSFRSWSLYVTLIIKNVASHLIHRSGMATHLAESVKIVCLIHHLRELREALVLFVYLYSIQCDGLCELSQDHEASQADKSGAEHLLSFLLKYLYKDQKKFCLKRPP